MYTLPLRSAVKPHRNLGCNVPAPGFQVQLVASSEAGQFKHRLSMGGNACSSLHSLLQLQPNYYQQYTSQFVVRIKTVMTVVG
jgi:hypothetical protein